ncbi:Beta-glucosidase 22 [Vitis vinifera]|uniref:Beta-glucosidase 22 n=1 Tax=Vitis vinifera TaxID=29760 RepID=A0A438KI09_VITVI|nr:Beta-glucosidase 22 [Vitis vinifera]
MTNETEDIIATQRTHDFFLGWMLNPKWFRNYWLFQYWFIFCHGEMDTCYVCRLSFKFNSYYRFVDVLVFGDYPGIVKKRAGTRIPSFSKDESKQVKDSFDFIGINHYSTLYIKNSPKKLNMDHRDFLQIWPQT